MSNVKVKDMTICAMFTVLIAVGAFIKIPIPVVPFTLQFFFVLMSGLLLGSKLGSLSVLIYTLLGLAGLPVFSEGGGIWYLAKPSFGYIIGFIIAAYVIGKMTENMAEFHWKRVLMANSAGLLIVYAVGMIYYYVICNFVIHAPIGLWPLFFYCFLLAVPGDICLCILSTFLYKRVRPVFQNLRAVGRGRSDVTCR